jgi:hypothetical protein
VRHTVVTKKKQPTMRARGPERDEDTRRRAARDTSLTAPPLAKRAETRFMGVRVWW